jgi:hypothetical protein
MRSICTVSAFLILLIWACNPGNKQEKPAAQPDSANIKSDSVMMSATGDLTYEIIPGQSGTYGYDILKNGKVYIHQPHIPGASGVEGFKAEGQARAAAELMITKLKNNIVPPTITEEELTEILKKN